MLKASVMGILIRFVMALIAIGIGIWYLSSSIGGAALTYTSTSNFLNVIGAGEDIAAANGCFFCGYVSELFAVIGRATEMFWNAIIEGLWILMAVGFGIFLFISAAMHIFKSAKQAGGDKPEAPKLEFKTWFDKVWRQGLRIMIVGVLIGGLGMGGTAALKTVTQITVTPVLFVGAELSMAASGVADATQCKALQAAAADEADVLTPVMAPFMCVIGNLNSVMLAGAAGGFALMNYAWMGMGGGVFTWLAGLTLVILFLIIGFNLFFQVLSVIFKLIFIIIFMPILLAATAFNKTWNMAENLVGNAMKILAQSAVQIVSITLKTIILYATVAYAADEFFPGPADGYSAILPPLLTSAPENPDAKTLSVMNVFSECEKVSIVDGEMDADTFKECFITKKAEVEARYPGAFDFLGDGWDFLLLMIGLFALYYYAVEPKINKLLGNPFKETKELEDKFDFGKWTKDLGKKAWSMPMNIFNGVAKRMGKS